MILQILLGFTGFTLINGYPTNQYYYDRRSIVQPPERQYLYELPPQTVYYYPRSADINRPVYYPQLGMSPQYHNLVYNYVTDFAGNQKPAEVPVRVGISNIQPGVQQPVSNVPQKIEEFDTDVSKPENEEGKVPVESETEDKNEGNKEETTEGPVKPGLNEHFLPSDFILLSNDPRSQFFGNFDAIKLKKMKFKSQPTTLPPLGGVISNYILLRDHPDYQNQFPFARNMPTPMNLQQLNKRQVYDSYDEGIVVSAENSQNSNTGGQLRQQGEQNNDNKEEDKEEEQPAVAQSKPSAIALAGPGGVAQASPVGTALVGPGGLAVSAPSGTAIAGPQGAAAVAVANPDEKVKADKMKATSESKGKEVKEENKNTSDSYYNK